MAETPIKLFMSYSWSSPEHEAWVLNLATQLRESGVDVILDKWDLKEGHDAVAFMEKMVTDPDVKKVIMVCDKKYVEKTDGRKGGVGTEAQIISAKIYKEVEQDKFVAVVAEKDEDGNPYLPTYYASRIYIDMSDDDLYSTNFEQVLRWVYGKPVHQKPGLGKKPEFLDEAKAISLGTSAKFRRAIDAIKNNKEVATGAVSEYLDSIVDNFESFRIVKKEGVEFDDQVVANIELFIPYRNELIEVFSALAQYRDKEEVWQVVHRFIERLIPFMDRPQHMHQWSEWDFDNYKFIVHELFLYLITVLLRYERFKAAAYFMDQRYLNQGARSSSREMIGFGEFHHHLKSLEYRNQRLKKNHISMHADLLEQRSKTSGQNFESVMQADMTLYTKGALQVLSNDGGYQHWWPVTLVYAERIRAAFEIYLRSESKKYFENLKVLFGIKSVQDLVQIPVGIGDKRLYEVKFDHSRMAWSDLVNLKNLATRT